MFTIALKQNQYLTYILSDSDAQSRAEIVPSRGGMITNWRIQGQDILYLDGDRFANPQLSVRGGIPILFPICGNLPNNTYTWGSEQYTLTQHGFARDLPWEVRQQTTDNHAGITLVLQSNKQTRAVYPFDFELAFTYILQGQSLKIHQRFTNHSSSRMPFSCGLHPYFLVLNKTQLNFEIPSTSYQDQIAKTIHPYNGSFDFSSGELDLAFTSLNGNSAAIADNQRRLRITIKYSDMFQTLVFWTVKGKDYVCLEPWSAPRNALNTGDQLSYVEPNNTQEATVEMVVS